MWQKRLGLDAWKIVVKQSAPGELRPGTLGNIYWDVDTHTARIRVLQATSYKTPYRVALEDMEFTVLHELIHLELASLPRSEASRGDEEEAVNAMTKALLTLGRNR